MGLSTIAQHMGQYSSSDCKVCLPHARLHYDNEGQCGMTMVTRVCTVDTASCVVSYSTTDLQDTHMGAINIEASCQGS